MSRARHGVLYAIAAYTLWGLLPLYWPLLKPSSPTEILAQRIIWTLLTVLALLTVTRHWSWIRTLARTPSRLALLGIAGVMVSSTWLTYIHAVNTNRTIEASLGYFTVPLVSVAFGVIAFRERLRRWQWCAVGLGVVAVVVLTIDYGRLPWIALVLAGAFGAYGLIKKFVNTGSTESLTVETLLLTAPAFAYVFLLQSGGTATFGHVSPAHTLLLVSTGIATAVPLLLFNAAATRAPLSVVGMIQYLAPILQFMIGLLIQHEPMPASRWIGFCLVWLALIILTSEALLHANAARRRAATAGQEATVAAR